MRPYLIPVALALFFVVLVGVFLQNGSENQLTPNPGPASNAASLPPVQKSPASLPADDASAELSQLSRALQTEIKARKVLEQKLARLEAKISNLENQTLSPEVPVPETANDDIDETRLPGPDQRWFDEQALIASGMSSTQARELKINFEQLELERLYLRDQSIRESWDREQYREALQSLDSREDEIKNQLSETEYDSYLYASGQTNRVAVTSVLESAPAASAGIEPGDHIIRYDNQRIYNWRELREATSSGTIGDTVAVEVDRNGRTLEFYLARGPLGIRMNSLSVAP